MANSPGQITALLRQAVGGNHTAEDALLRAVYAELHRLAVRHMRKEGRLHTLQPTALVNEAYVRLLRGGEQDWNDRVHFLAAASIVMRRVLVDHARRRAAAKRGANPAVGELEDWIGAEQHAPETILAVDQALSRLAEAEPRQARIVEMRFFSGLTDQEVADALKVSVRTVKRDWSLAKAWLYTQLRN